MKQRDLWKRGILSLTLVFGLFFMACEATVTPDTETTPPAGTTTGITYTVSANGTANSADSTTLTLTFASAVTGLTAADIAVTGSAAKTSTATLSGTGPYTLPITVSAEGNASVTVTKTGVDSTAHSVTVHKAGTTTGTAKTLTITGIHSSWNGKSASVALYGDDLVDETVLMPDSKVSGYSTAIANGSVTWELKYADINDMETFAENWTGTGPYYIRITLDSTNTVVADRIWFVYSTSGSYGALAKYTFSNATTTLQASSFPGEKGYKASEQPTVALPADPTATGGSVVKVRSNNTADFLNKKVYIVVYDSDTATVPLAWGVTVGTETPLSGSSTQKGVEVQLQTWAATTAYTVPTGKTGMRVYLLVQKSGATNYLGYDIYYNSIGQSTTNLTQTNGVGALSNFTQQNTSTQNRKPAGMGF